MDAQLTGDCLCLELEASLLRAIQRSWLCNMAGRSETGQEGARAGTDWRLLQPVCSLYSAVCAFSVGQSGRLLLLNIIFKQLQIQNKCTDVFFTHFYAPCSGFYKFLI